MSDNVNITVQDTINEIVVNTAVVVETIDINVQVAVDEVNIIANPNNYVVNINRIIGEQVQSDWNQNDDQEPDYIKNKPSIPSIAGLATVVYVDQQDALKVDKVAGSRLITSAESTLLGNTSGINTGDQDLSNLVVKNTAIVGATKTKITFDAKGLVTSGADATTADIADSLDKRYVTDANLTTIGNQSGVNTGDETTATIKTKLGITTLSGNNTGDQDLSGLTPNTRSISTTTPLQGGGDLSANRTLSILQSDTTQSGFLSNSDWNTFNGKFNLPSLTSGSVLFSNGTTIAQDNANLFWDDTNNRFNIGGISSNTARLGIKAPGALSTDIALRVRNSADSGDLMTVNGLGNLRLFGSSSLEFVNGQTIKDNGSAGLAINIGGGQVFSIIVPTVLIGTTTNIPSSKLTIESTTQGFLPPRMTTIQRNTIASPATGLIVYDTTLLSEFQYNGTAWVTYQPQLNGTGFVKALGTTISYDNSVYAPIIAKQILLSSITGTNVNTIITSHLLSANLFSQNDFLDILCSVYKPTTSNNATLRVYLNSSVSLTGATLVGTYVLSSTTKFVNFQRTHVFLSTGTNGQFWGFPPTVSSITDRSITNIEITPMLYNNENSGYVIFALQLSNSADQVGINGIKISK